MMGTTLPTIKSENSTSPGLSTPATTVKVEEGVALPELVDVKVTVSSANGNSSPGKGQKD